MPTPLQRIDALLSRDGGLSQHLSGTFATANAITTGDYICRLLNRTTDYCQIHRILVKITRSTGNLNIEKYGDAELTEGIVISIKHDNGDIKHRFNPKALTRIDDWTLIAGQGGLDAAQRVVALRWSLYKGSESPRIDCAAGEHFSFELFEDCTGLSAQYVAVQGEYVSSL